VTAVVVAVDLAEREIPVIIYTRVWRAARELALAKKAQATPPARRPYYLRHAAVSTWLAGGVDPVTVAGWAGHSLSVLMEVYAACLYGQDAARADESRRRWARHQAVSLGEQWAGLAGYSRA
jgi:integrase